MSQDEPDNMQIVNTEEDLNIFANQSGLPINYTNISNERRSLIIRAIDQLGMSISAVATQFCVASSTVANIKKAYYANGQIEKKTNRGRPSTILSGTEAAIICDWLDNDCLLSLRAIRDGCERHFSKTPSLSTLSRIIRAFHYTLKRTSVQPERRNNNETIHARAVYAEHYLSIMAHREKIFFIDESGFCVSMRRRQGRARIGMPAVVRVPAVRTKNFSLCAAYNVSTMFHFNIQERAYNTSSFSVYMTQIIQKLSESGIEHVIFVMDNVAFHHHSAITALVSEAGHQLAFLPPYSPFLNPIEEVFSKWKNYVKTCKPTNEEQLFAAIMNGAQSITQADCGAYYSHMESYIGRCLRFEEIED